MKKKWKNIIICAVISATALTAVTMHRMHMLNDFIITTDVGVSETTAPEQTADADAEERKININTADADELTELKGIGEALSERIVDYRTENGPFVDIEDIMKVSGIGEKKFEDIRRAITVGE